MSVINKMLRDLDKRGGLGPRTLEEGMKEIERVPLVEDDERRPWGRISAIVIVLGLAGAIAWYVLQQPSPAKVAATKPPAPAANATPPAAPPATTPSSSQTTPSPSQTTPSASQTTPSPSQTTPSSPAATPPPAVAISKPATPVEAPPSSKVASAPAPTQMASSAPASAPPKPAPAADDRKREGPGTMLELPSMAATAVSKQQEASAKAQVPRPEIPVSPKLAAATSTPVAKVDKVESPPPKTETATLKAETPAPKAEMAAPRPQVPATEAPIRAASKAAEKTEPDDSSPVRISVDRNSRPLAGAALAVAEYRAANEQLARGRSDLAIASYGAALKADPRHVPARQAMVVVMLEQGRAAEARAALREGIDTVPGNSVWPMLLARLQVESGDVPGGIATLEHSLSTAGASQPDYQAFLATLLQMQSRHAEAIKYYQSALQLAPDSGRLLTGVAISLEAEKRVAEAKEAYRRALATNNLGRDLEAYAQDRLKQLK